MGLGEEMPFSKGNCVRLNATNTTGHSRPIPLSINNTGRFYISNYKVNISLFYLSRLVNVGCLFTLKSVEKRWSFIYIGVYK